MAWWTAIWAGDGVSRRSTDCVHIYLGKALIETSSCTQGTIAMSSGEAELYALVRGAATGLQIQYALAEHGLPATVTVYSDS